MCIYFVSFTHNLRITTSHILPAYFQRYQTQTSISLKIPTGNIHNQYDIPDIYNCKQNFCLRDADNILSIPIINICLEMLNETI